MKELKFISRYVKRHGLSYLLGIVALFAVDLMNVYIPRYTGEITDGLETQSLEMAQIWTLILRHRRPGAFFLALLYLRRVPLH